MIKTSAKCFDGSSSISAENEEPSSDFSKIFVQIHQTFE